MTSKGKKKTNRIELSNGVYLDLQEKSRGVYKIIEQGRNGKSLTGMVLEAIPKKRQFQDIEAQTTDREQWDWVAGSTSHFKYKDMEFDFYLGEIHAPSAKAVREVLSKLDISLVDAADSDY
jgi:hypothetical protein